MTGLYWSREFIRHKRGTIQIMVGRPRKQGYRSASGVLSRAKVDPDAWTRDLDRLLYEPTAVYVTEAGAMTKIGITKNPSQRSKEIQTSNGYVVRFVWYQWMHGPDAKSLERAIHKQYQGTRFHAHGEWYYFDTDTAIGLVSQKIKEMGFFAIWHKWTAYVERHWDDPTRENLPNPFTQGAS